jgi:Cystathionine beta-lyases/cystathionine gamma-synthases
MSFQLNTKCVHGNNEARSLEHTGAISYPIYQTATFAHPSVGESTGFDYSRSQNPTREQLEKIVASLEDAYGAVAFSSGMAASNALMELFSPGDHILASTDLYGGTIRLFQHINVKNGLEIEFIDTADLELVSSKIKNHTKAIFVETPTNPMMNVTDLQAIGKLAKQNNLLFIADNTFLSPYFQKPIHFGADIVLHSGTKFLGGHNDTLAGFLVLANKELDEKIRFIVKTTGAGLAPFDCWLILRGIKTLPLRMEYQQKNALIVAEWLQKQDKVKAVYYIGLPSHPGYEINKKQASGSGSMISFHVHSEETAVNLLNKVKLIQYAESLGGVESLITYPMLQTHADVPEAEREAKGINRTLLRFSVGIEHIDDILHDLEQAFEN